MEKLHKKTKIVATIGPASADKKTLESMIAKGVDVCRLNFSHGSQQDHLKVIQNIREINEEHEYVNVPILADLQGPKIRIGKMKEGGAILHKGQPVEITTREVIGDENTIYITYPEFPKDVKSGETILLDDGKIQLKVLSTNIANLKNIFNSDIYSKGVYTNELLSYASGMFGKNAKLYAYPYLDKVKNEVVTTKNMPVSSEAKPLFEFLVNNLYIVDIENFDRKHVKTV